MTFNVEPEFDFGLLNLDELEHKLNITVEEIISVYMNVRTTAFRVKDVCIQERPYHCVGFGFRGRPLSILLEHYGDRCLIINVKIANENEIEFFWCRKDF